MLVFFQSESRDTNSEPWSTRMAAGCEWLRRGIEARRFSPFPDPPARVIKVYSIGRRHEGIHRIALEAAERGKFFYLYDTLAGGNTDSASSEVYDYRNTVSLRKQFETKSVFRGSGRKMDSTDETGGQVEVGARNYEGAAAGAVMLGEAPDGKHTGNYSGGQKL
jgi:hypothetical protein